MSKILNRAPLAAGLLIPLLALSSVTKADTTHPDCPVNCFVDTTLGASVNATVDLWAGYNTYFDDQQGNGALKRGLKTQSASAPTTCFCAPNVKVAEGDLLIGTGGGNGAPIGGHGGPPTTLRRRNFRIQNTPAGMFPDVLTTVHFPNLERVEGAFDMEGAMSLVTVAAPKLRSVTERLVIEMCEELQEVLFPNLALVRSDFVLAENSKLWRFDANLEIVLGEIALEMVDLPDLSFLRNIKRMSTLLVNELPNMTELVLPSLELVHGALELEGCEALRKMSMNSLVRIDLLMVAGAPALEEASFSGLQLASMMMFTALESLHQLNLCSLKFANPMESSISITEYEFDNGGAPVAPANCWLNRAAISASMNATHIPLACNASMCPTTADPVSPQSPAVEEDDSFVCPAECLIEDQEDFGLSGHSVQNQTAVCYCAPNVRNITSPYESFVFGPSSAMKAVYFPRLTFLSWDLGFNQLPLLEKIYAPRLQHVGSLGLVKTGAAGAAPLSFPSLTYVQEIMLEEVPLVTPFHFPLLTNVPYRVELRAVHGMKDLGFLSNATSIGVGIVVDGADALETVELPFLQYLAGDVHEGGALKLTQTPALKVVSLPKLESAGSTIHIVSGADLEKVSFPLMEEVFGGMVVQSNVSIKSFQACRLRNFGASLRTNDGILVSQVNVTNGGQPEQCAIGVDGMLAVNDVCTRDVCRVPCAQAITKCSSGQITGAFDNTLLGESNDCRCECDNGVMGDACDKCSQGFGPSYPNCKPACASGTCNNKGNVSGFEGSCACACEEGFDGATCERCKTGYGPAWPECVLTTTTTTTTTAAPTTTTTTAAPTTTTSTPVPPPTIGQISPCPNADTAFALSEGQRHRIDSLQFASVTEGNQTSCAFRFSCPATSNGMAIRITKSVPQGSQLSVSANVPTTSGAIAQVSATTGLVAVVARTDVEVTAIGTGGSFAVVASCLTGNIKIPQNADDVRYVDAPFDASAPGAEDIVHEFDVTGSSQRRQVAQGSEKVVLLSCATSDVTASNPVVQIRSIAGTLGPATNDTLTVTALDSELAQTFSGEAVNRAFAPTTDVSTFAASSQYFVTYSTDSPVAAASPVTISYSCANTAWFRSGAGAQSSGVAMPGYLLAAAVAVIFASL